MKAVEIHDVAEFFDRDFWWKAAEVNRIMEESRKRFCSERMIESYQEIYREINQRQIS